MTNFIKYSLNGQDLSLKKGNFWIGTGDVFKGPTSETDYWNGITPPSSGYTIYQNKASQGPSIYVANNDSELISFTNHITNSGFTTADDCLIYFSTQSDKMVTNIDYPTIITSGLVYCLDAGFTPSYPRSGSTWTDLAQGFPLTLYNTPSFGSSNQGLLTFDGATQYGDATSANAANINNDLTITVWFQMNANANGTIISKGGNYKFEILSGDPFAVQLSYQTGKNPIRTFSWQIASYSANTWYNVTGTWGQVSTQTGMKLYSYGLPLPRGQSGLLNNNVTSNSSNLIISSDSSDNYFNGKIAIIQIYNRSLSDAEILTNYNNIKSRFGL